MAERFHALDVETANIDIASICSIGIVTVEDGREVDRWYSLIDPEDSFDAFNIRIHGIHEADVKGAPTFRSLASRLSASLSDEVVVTHTRFDRTALHQAHAKYDIQMFDCRWLDSSRVIRRAWPDESAQRGYGLANAAHWAGIDFNHHNAEEDARAAGLLIARAIAETGLSLEEWYPRVQHPIGPGTGSASLNLKGNPDGPLHGETVCFTGALVIPRREAAQVAAVAGCNVGSGVTKKTTILVVGQQDLDRLAGYEKSSKQRKAERLIQEGQSIRIVSERDFLMATSLKG